MTGVSGQSPVAETAAVVPLVKSHEAGSHGARAKPILAGSFLVATVAPFLALLAIVDLYLLVQFWRASAGIGEIPPAAQDVTAFGATFTQVPRETLFFAVVILAGVLGGSVHSLRSLSWYVGGQRFVRSWTLRYLYLPIIGALLAFILYIIVRAGFLAGAAVDATSPFGFASLGALAGLFSDQGVKKLRDVFEILLTKAEEGPQSRNETVADAKTG